MTIPLILLSIVLFGMQTVALKKIRVTTLRENLLEIGISSGAIAVCFWVWGAFTGIRISPVTLFWGILFGVVFIATITSYYYAMQTGPLSYTAFFYSSSMIIPALAGVIIWKDEFRWTVGLGIALFLAAFYFISVPGAQESSRGNRKWMVLCFVTWLLNGSLSVIVKTQQMAMKGEEASSLTTVAFSCACVLCVLFYFLLLARSGKQALAKSELAGMRSVAIPLLALAVGNGGGNLTVTYLSSRVSSAYLFPFVLGGMMVGVTIYSVLALKEKINRYGAVGLALGVAGLLAINL